jgi:hypothetical protein
LSPDKDWKLQSWTAERGIANELTDASVTAVDADHGPLSIESEVDTS